MVRPPLKWLFASLLSVVALAACTTSSTMLPASEARIIDDGSSFGQSFTAQNRGLSGVSVLLAPSNSEGKGSLLFHLLASPQSTVEIARARLPISEITRQAYYKFDFPPQSDSQRKDYFLQVDVIDGGQVVIYSASGDSYLDGTLYENNSPQDAQLGFRLEYDRQAYLLGIFPIIIGWLLVLVIGAILFILPGWGLFSLLWRGWNELNWAAKLCLSAGLSLAIYPLLMLWTNLVGLHLGFLYALLPPIAGLVALIWTNRKFFTDIPTHFRQRDGLFGRPKMPSAETILADISFVAVLGLIVTSRFWIIRSLDVPLFGDSYQHTMITQLMIDHGGLFDSWQPYADLVTFTYHFGFHSAVAVYHWMSGASVEKSMLWIGQLINIIAILSLYPLAFKVKKNRWAGVIAMLIAGLISPMPNYYVNWGRYTQLAGQAVLPTVIWCAWSILERPHIEFSNLRLVRKLTSWRFLNLDLGSQVVVWLALGGVALTHYRILILAVLFFPAIGLFSLLGRKFGLWLGRTAWIGIGGLILFLPWFIHVFGGKIIKMFAAEMTQFPSQTTTTARLINSIQDFQTYLPLVIWILFVISVAWGFWKRSKDLIIFIFWWFLIVLATNPQWFRLPGTGVITNFAILIAFYIPASIAIGAALSWFVEKIQPANMKMELPIKSNISTIMLNTTVLVGICLSGIWGLPNRLRDVNVASFALVTRPDIRAMTWIRDNLPVEADFLVNSFFAYNNSVVVGSDGGWWIPILAGRKTSLPPLTYGFEMGVGSATTETANHLAKEIQEKGIDNPEIISLLLEEGIKYIYIGQRQGSVNYQGPQVLEPENMRTIPNFKVVYHQDRVWIFEVLP